MKAELIRFTDHLPLITSHSSSTVALGEDAASVVAAVLLVE